MTRPVRTPYDGSATPFTIGLRVLDPREWVEVDDDLDVFLAEKERLYAAVPDRVFAAEPDTRAAQAEVLEMLAGHLPARFLGRFRRLGETIEIDGGGRRVRLDETARPPLRTASMLIAEDLLLMRKGGDGWRLAAAALCFPSSWSLAEKFGRPLADIHAPVPGFQRGTRTAALIERMFDNMKVEQPVERVNWSLQDDDSLHLPQAKRERDRRVEESGSSLLGTDPLASTFIRVERQTLRKLPVSGDILFTIRIHLDPVEALARHRERRSLCAALAGQLAALDAAQLGYKGLVDDRDRLVAALHELAEA